MYNWIETTFNVSGGVTQAIAVILALAVVLLLFALFIFILKRLMGGQTSPNRNRQPRIAVMDSATIDARRRLVLVRRDNIEHLILIGGPSDVVVEQNILRNAPLTQQRPGQTASLGNQAPVRAPVAPGPDIPARPDDLAAQNEPVPPLLDQARPPAPSVAASPAPPPARAVPVPQTREMPSASAARPASPVSAKSAETSPPPQATPPIASPAAPETPLATSSSAGKRPDRAADLLKAAAQNGFSRTFGKDKKEPTKTSENLASPSKGETAALAQAAASPLETPSAASGSSASSKLKSLARPFSPRERPSYGGHSISPPASGPAARAKTALLKPRETASAQEKVEPVMSAAGAQSETETSSTETSQAAAVVADNIPDAHASTAGDADAQTAPAAAETASEIKKDVSEQAEGNTGTDHQDEANQDKIDVASGTDDKTASDASTPDASGPEQSPDITLDMNDLLEDLPQTGTPAAEAASEEKAPAGSDQTPAEQDTPATQDASVKQDTPHQAPTNTAPAIQHRPTEQKKPAEPVKAAPRPTGTLGDRNPIEDEMAKILDELGGPSN
ncbi:flagellar biosynthetic protein FliO [Roseibium sp.]|uniref:flagellar biosynthetic protein FliO n=1 Tax=Roseibium sp. TaxID=1936156 RepID=UPI003BB0FA13